MRLTIQSFRPSIQLAGPQIRTATFPCISQISSRPSQQRQAMATVSPFTKAVVASMRHLYPEILADKSFDNTGLLLEAPLSTHLPRKANSVLLTIDLTKAVADEAIEENHSVVVAYHPIIFRGLKSITFNNSQQQTLLRLASQGVSVYCPHTAVDHTPDGMADWLCDIVAGKIEPSPEPQASTAASEEGKPSNPSEVDVTSSDEDDSASQVSKGKGKTAEPNTKNNDTPSSSEERPAAVHRNYSKPAYPTSGRGQDSPSQRALSPIRSSSTTFHYSTVPHKRTVITPMSSADLKIANSAKEDSEPRYTIENTGSGRLLTFDDPHPLSSLVTRIAHATGTPKGFPVAIPQSQQLESIKIRTVGICPGSGSSVIARCHPPPDLVFTGEMSHHEALAVIERGGCVISLFHSNSERGYLDAVMRERLEQNLKERWAEKKDKFAEEDDETVKDILADESVSVLVSQRDRDPFGIVVLQESNVEGEKVS